MSRQGQAGTRLMDVRGVEAARRLVESVGAVYLRQEPCGCHIYALGDGGAAIATRDCDIDHEPADD